VGSSRFTGRGATGRGGGEMKPYGEKGLLQIRGFTDCSKVAARDYGRDPQEARGRQGDGDVLGRNPLLPKKRIAARVALPRWGGSDRGKKRGNRKPRGDKNQKCFLENFRVEGKHGRGVEGGRQKKKIIT